MSNNIWPEKIIKTHNGDGTTTTSEIYSLDAYRNLGFLGVIGICFLVAIFSPLLGAFILLGAVFFGYDFRINIISFLISLYYLIDLHNGWIISMLVAFRYKVNELQPFIYLNGAVILASVILLLFGYQMYQTVKKIFDEPFDVMHPFKITTKVNLTYGCLTFVLFLICWLASYIIFSSGIIKII